jgi:hypothetical protein
MSLLAQNATQSPLVCSILASHRMESLKNMLFPKSSEQFVRNWSESPKGKFRHTNIQSVTVSVLRPTRQIQTSFNFGFGMPRPASPPFSENTDKIVVAFFAVALEHTYIFIEESREFGSCCLTE